MAVIGVELDPSELVLTKGRDFKWTFVNQDMSGTPLAFPAGSLFFEIFTSPVTTWEFDVTGSDAVLKIESTEVDEIPARTRWQLVFKPAGEAAGGDPLAIGTVRVQK